MRDFKTKFGFTTIRAMSIAPEDVDLVRLTDAFHHRTSGTFERAKILALAEKGGTTISQLCAFSGKSEEYVSGAPRLLATRKTRSAARAA